MESRNRKRLIGDTLVPTWTDEETEWALSTLSTGVTGVDDHESHRQELELLLDVMPERVRMALRRLELDDLMEIVLDLGRPAEARFSGGALVDLGSERVTHDDIHHVTQQVGAFTNDNRAGIPRTLHRISAIRNRQGDAVGLTCRVGKAVTGTLEPIRDLIESGKSVLLLGRPGVGKTTKLRQVAKLLADMGKRVIIVDTSNEIAGDGDIPHPAVGRARRMQVSQPEHQQHIMIEAVENHTPEVIIVDEIGTEEEALAARTIAERGVMLVATAHGGTLESLVKNPLLSDLVGGIETVTLGDEEAKRRGTQKSVLERAKKPTFEIAIEIRDRATLAVYPDVAEAVDNMLRGWTLFPEMRKFDETTGEHRKLSSNLRVLPGKVSPETLAMGVPMGVVASEARQYQAAEIDRPMAGPPAVPGICRVFLYAVTRSFVDRIIDRLNLTRQVFVTQQIHDAHAIIALRGQARPGSKLLRLANDYEVPVYYCKTNTMPQIQRTIREALEAVAPSIAGRISGPFGLEAGLDGEADLLEEAPADETTLALREAREAIDAILSGGGPVELAPRRSYIRRLQHELVEKHQLKSVSIGDEPMRRLKLLPLLPE